MVARAVSVADLLMMDPEVIAPEVVGAMLGELGVAVVGDGEVWVRYHERYRALLAVEGRDGTHKTIPPTRGRGRDRVVTQVVRD